MPVGTQGERPPDSFFGTTGARAGEGSCAGCQVGDLICEGTGLPQPCKKLRRNATSFSPTRRIQWRIFINCMTAVLRSFSVQ